MEDSVPPAEKENARALVQKNIPSLKAAGKTVHVRVNHLDTGLTRDDIMAVVHPDLAGLAFPKAEGAQHIRDLDVMIREAETRNGVRPGTTVLIPSIESAKGVLRCEGSPWLRRAWPASRSAHTTTPPTWASPATPTAASSITRGASSSTAAPLTACRPSTRPTATSATKKAWSRRRSTCVRSE